MRLSQSDTGCRMRSRGTETNAAEKSKINVREARDATAQRRMGPRAVRLPAFLSVQQRKWQGSPSRPQARLPTCAPPRWAPLAQHLARCRLFPLLQKELQTRLCEAEHLVRKMTPDGTHHLPLLNALLLRYCLALFLFILFIFGCLRSS